ncbi:MAG: 1-acyl-sn-glycerol-3-phosphate acyltransferase [Candidatus Omnitrophica bacterium]|nr:1-acyl-sn-glycerol-3-phosphate acyltransferase [Candidatus Omnitrophota bacterium]
MIYTITVVILIVIFKLFFRIRIQGLDNIPTQGAFILASNHNSYLDPPILAVGCYRKKRKLSFLAKQELFHNRIFGWYIKKLGAFPIRRNWGDISAIKESIRRIRNGQPLVIFPEGGRSLDGKIKEGFPGIALLASKTKIPVIPAFIKGSDCVLDGGIKSLRFCRIYIKFGKPLIFYRERPQYYSEVTDRIMTSIGELSDIS